MPNKPLSVDRTLSKAKTLERKGDWQQALQLYTTVLEKFPTNIRALKGLRELKKSTHASPEFTDRADFPRNQIEGLIGLYNAGKFREALELGTALLKRFPNVPSILNILGAVKVSLGSFDVAIADFLEAIRIKPDYAEAHNNLGSALNSLGRQDEAVLSLVQALEVTPDYAEAHNNLGSALHALGKQDEAASNYKYAININPNYADAYHNLAHVDKYSLSDSKIEKIVSLAGSPTISEQDLMHLKFALGIVYERTGNFEESFLCFSDANRVRKKVLNYDISSDKRLFKLIKSMFEFYEPSNEVPKKHNLSSRLQPIFVVGMPRSGTTLVEQILSSHSKVYGAGELNILNKLVSPVTDAYIQGNAVPLAPDLFGAIGSGYYDFIQSLNLDERYVIDKMPVNFRWIGFILGAMPHAKIINLQRDPIATCWSIYKCNFSSMGNGYAYDLLDIAEYYNLYANLMDFWNERFPGKIYNLDYDVLTENQELETRRLLEYCGLEWEDKCLEFYKTERAVVTASSGQVRQKMYQGSSNAWQKYAQYLQPMIEALGR